MQEELAAEIDAKAVEVMRPLSQKVAGLEIEMERLVKARECADEAAKNLENELRRSVADREKLLREVLLDAQRMHKHLKSGYNGAELFLYFTNLKEKLKQYGEPS